MTLDEWKALLEYRGGNPAGLGIPPDIAAQLGVDLPETIQQPTEEEDNEMASKKETEPVQTHDIKKKRYFDGSTCAFKGCQKPAEGYVSAIKATKDHEAGRLWYGPACKNHPGRTVLTLAELAHQRDGASDLALVLDVEVGDVLKRLEEAGIDEKGKKLGAADAVDYESPITEDQLNGTQQASQEAQEEAQQAPQQTPEAQQLPLAPEPEPKSEVVAQTPQSAMLSVVAPPVQIPSEDLQHSQGAGMQVLGTLQTFEIRDQQGMELAGSLLRMVKEEWNRLDAVRKHIGKPLREKLKEIQGHFKPVQDIYEQAEAILKGKISEATQQMMQAQAQAMAAAQQAHQQGDQQAMAVATQQAAQTDVQLPKGVHTRKVARFQVVDPSQLPGEFWTPDRQKIQAYVDAGWRQIPGVQIWEEEVVIGRAS